MIKKYCKSITQKYLTKQQQLNLIWKQRKKNSYNNLTQTNKYLVARIFIIKYFETL